MALRAAALLFAFLCLLQIGPSAHAAPANWDDFKSRFLMPEGRIIDTGNDNVSHSEGQGYGMVMAVAYDDRAAFDRIWQWTDKTLSRRDVRLFSWRYDPGPGQVTDPNNATDGDLLIAWALQRASLRWNAPEYARASQDIREAILSKLPVRAGGRTLLAPGLTGFVQPDSVMINPSYAVMPALDAFAKLEPKSAWPLLRDESLRMLRDGLFGVSNLPTDWVRVDLNGVMWTEPTRPPQFGFDAIRVPLYLCWSGRCGDKALDGVKRWWGQTRQTKPPAWIDVRTAEVAAFPVSAGGEEVVRLTLGESPGGQSTHGEDYYSSALLILSDIAAQDLGRERRPVTEPARRPK
jgi:endoglucanase